MADEDALIKATKNKGRSASVCFSSSSARHHERSSIEAVGVSPPATPPPYGGGSLYSSGSASATPPAAKPGRRAAHRSQSARLTGGKSVRRRLPPTERDAEPVPDSPHSIKSVVSDPRLYDYEASGTSSPVSFRRKGSARRVNSVHHSHTQRKSAAFLDIPKSQSNSNNQETDENSYRLRSFSFTNKGLVNRGDSFRRRHNRSNSVFPTSTGSLVDEQQQEVLEQICNEQITRSPDNTTTTYNVSVTGTTGVGKTSLISQFMTSECINAYDRDREGPSQQTVSIMLNGEESELCFQELKSSKAFQKKHTFDAFLIIYSVVDKSTFQQAELELSRLQDANVLNTRPAILVGNKIDLARSRTVSPQDGKCLACTFRVKYIEISVGINHNVDELLVGILTQIRLKKKHVEQELGCGSGGSGSHTHHWYKSRGVMRASMKARQMFTWIFGLEDSKFKNCENLHTL